MKRVATRALMVAVIGGILWGQAGKPATRISEEVPERVRGTWRLADTVAAGGVVRAFRLEATRVVPLDPTGRDLRAYPLVEVATTSGRERLWGVRLYFGPKTERIRVHFGREHPTVVAEHIEPVDGDRV